MPAFALIDGHALIKAPITQLTNSMAKYIDKFQKNDQLATEKFGKNMTLSSKTPDPAILKSIFCCDPYKTILILFLVCFS